MSKYIVKNTKELKGEVFINGSKNSCLPILAACLLTEEECEITNVPNITDIEIMINILTSLKVKTNYNRKKKILKVDASGLNPIYPSKKFSELMRASSLIAGPILSRCKISKIFLPGGCAIGKRPIDMHIQGFISLGAFFVEKISDDDNYLLLKTKNLIGTEIFLDYPSVGTTENLIMASVFAKGVTILKNTAKEPEIVDLINFLNKMGAKIVGGGTDIIKITGVEKLKGCSYEVIPDRVEAATYISAAVTLRSDIVVKNVIASHLFPLISKYKEMGIDFEVNDKNDRQDIKVIAKNKPLHSTKVITQPYPGFPTDFQSIMLVSMLSSAGESEIEETVFENRFMICDELKKLNASIKVKDNKAIIFGGIPLTGTEVKASDLRSGAALIIAGFLSKGETVIDNIGYIKRGYENIVKNFKELGGNIKEVD